MDKSVGGDYTKVLCFLILITFQSIILAEGQYVSHHVNRAIVYQCVESGIKCIVPTRVWRSSMVHWRCGMFMV